MYYKKIGSCNLLCGSSLKHSCCGGYTGVVATMLLIIIGYLAGSPIE